MPLGPAREGSAAASIDNWLASGAKTATGNTATGTYQNYLGGPVTQAVVQINVTAVSGTTPTLDVDLEDSVDNGVTWNKVADINGANITATGVTVARLNLANTPCAPNVRFKYTIGGTTPSFTFSIDAAFARA